MPKKISLYFYLVKILTYSIVLWIIIRFFLKKLFSPASLRWYVIFTGVSIFCITLGFAGWRSVLNRGPQTILADEFMEYTPLEDGAVSTTEESTIDEPELPLPEENNTEYALPNLQEEPIYAYPELEPEQSDSEYLLPEAPFDPIMAFQETQNDQFSSYELPSAPETPQYAYQPSQYEELSSVVDLPPAEATPVYAYQEPIYPDPPLVAAIPETHPNMALPVDQTKHQAMPAESVMSMEPATPNHQSEMNMDNLPMPDYSQMNGNGAVAMDTHQMTNNLVTTYDPSHTNMPQPQMSEHITMPSAIVMNSNHPMEMPGMDQTPGIHQIVMSDGHTQRVMVGHSGSDTLTIPSIAHQMTTTTHETSHTVTTPMNMNSGHTTMNMTTPTSSHSEHINMGSQTIPSTTMNHTGMTMMPNHTTTSHTNTIHLTSPSAPAYTGIIITPNQHPSDHTGMAISNPIVTSATHPNHAIPTTAPTFGTLPTHQNHLTPDQGTPTVTMHHGYTQSPQTSNPTYNAFHTNHPSNPSTNNPVITSATSGHNQHTTPIVNQLPSSQPTIHSQHSMTLSDHNEHPTVVSTEQTNIRELPRTGVSSLLLMGLAALITLIYVKKRSRQIEIMTANSLWNQRQLSKFINS
jgi:hypothetical protein